MITMKKEDHMNLFKNVIFIYCCLLLVCYNISCETVQPLTANDSVVPLSTMVSADTANSVQTQNNNDATDKNIPIIDEASQTVALQPSNNINNNAEQSLPTASTSPSATPAPDLAAQPNATEENPALKQWNDHLTSFLAKGAFWDASTNAPTNEWITKTFDIAKEVLTHSIAQAEELKASFLKTINQKFVTVENGTNIEGIARLISEFDKKIEDLVKELSTKNAPTPALPDTLDKNVTAQETQPSTIKTESEPVADEQINNNQPSQEISQQSDSEIEKSNTKKNKQQRQWQESLENLKTEGITQEEATSILNETIEMAQKIINSKDSDLQNNEFEILSSEFKESLESRYISSDKKLYKIDILSSMEQFKSACFPQTQVKKMNQNTMIESDMRNNQQPIIEQSSQPINQNKPALEQKGQKPTQQKNESDKAGASAPLDKNNLLPNAPVNYGASFSDMLSQDTENIKNAAERERQRILQEHQQALLAKNIQHAAVQKVIAEKAAAEKGILSSIAGAVLGEWWTGTDSTMKNMQEFKKQQESSLITMINSLFDPITNEVLSTDSKELIKTAYYKCQDLILAFNTKEFWDSTAQEPNEKWITKIKKPLSLLIRYGVMEIDDVIAIMHETLKSKMLGGKLEEFEKNTRTFLESEKEKIKKERNDYINAQRVKEQKIKEEKRKALEREQQERLDRQNEVLRQEREVLENMEKANQQRFEAQENMRKLDGEWKQLLKTIETSTDATVEQNNSWTQDALSKTQELLRLATIVQVDPKEIISKRKTDFSNALLKQKQGSGLGVDVGVAKNMEDFNKGVHV